MKILSVVIGTLSDTAASIRILHLANILHSAGHEVHLVRFMRAATLKTLNTAFDLSNIPNSIVLVSTPTLHLKVMREIERGSYDLVFGNAHLSTFSSMLGRLRGTPLVFDMHGGLVEELLLKIESTSGWERLLSLFQLPMNKVIDLIDLHFSSRILCVSKRMIRYLHEKRRVPLEKMAYVTNGVDLDFFKPSIASRTGLLREELGLKNKLVFGYVGGFDRWQGVENFIEAARRINDPELAFLIIGSEKKLVEKNMLFFPRMPRDRLPDYYSVCDVLVLPRPSHIATEIAAPTKFAEYTAMGKPVLTTDVGDAAEFVRKHKCGIVVPSNHPTDLIDGIYQFKDLAESERELMGKNSRDLAESLFDWGKIADTLLKTIQGI